MRLVSEAINCLRPERASSSQSSQTGFSPGPFLRMYVKLFPSGCHETEEIGRPASGGSAARSSIVSFFPAPEAAAVKTASASVPAKVARLRVNALRRSS